MWIPHPVAFFGGGKQPIGYRSSHIRLSHPETNTQSLFHGQPSVLCKILGLYETEVHNRVTGKRAFSQLVRRLVICLCVCLCLFVCVLMEGLRGRKDASWCVHESQTGGRRRTHTHMHVTPNARQG